MQQQEIIETLNRFPFWYHKIELGQNVVTPGWAPLNRDSYGIPENFTGKRVLDVGAWDGYWTFEALRRGADEVVAVDDFSDFLAKLPGEARRVWETFDFCKSVLGYSDDRCKRFEMNIYEIDKAGLGKFDIVFLFGVVYHLRYPLYALDLLSAMCVEEIYIESAILDDYSPYEGGLDKGYPGSQMVMEFYPGKEYGNNETNWWCPTLSCLKSMVAASGFNQVEAWKLQQKPSALPHCRGFVKGGKR